MSTAHYQTTFPTGKFFATAQTIALLIVPLTMPEALSAAQYFVDCASGNDGATGREATSAWRTLDKINQTSFSPGDLIQLKRGTTCLGMLWPKGSGTSDGAIVIGAYGTGALPLIDAKGLDTAIKLFNQHHWEIRNLEATRSTEYGIHVG